MQVAPMPKTLAIKIRFGTNDSACRHCSRFIPRNSPESAYSITTTGLIISMTVTPIASGLDLRSFGAPIPRINTEMI